MPRFFFDVADGDDVHRDDMGSDLPDAEEARKEALAALAEIARDELPRGDHHVFAATIRDESGTEIYKASLALDGEWIKKKRVRSFWP